jgi:cytochrome b561
MALRNGPDSFGLVTRLIHWVMAVLILFMFALGLRLTSMEPGLSNLWLYGLHKTVGISLLALVVLRILWHLASPPPAPIGPPGRMRLFVKTWHRALYALMLATPIAGWAGSSASGIDTVVFGSITLPALVAPGETAESVCFILHEILAKTLIGMVVVHILGAIRREIAGDGTLTRMLRGHL